ncbi:peptidoglycan-binding domain-containing protein [Dolichospermum circinale]|uniref:peptidoglycan-binding domain-containing protein n=1 Tax=Dolichospermum circinale TaxID=109265 RepID=UPI0004223CC8|nr:peptidoglycan-binding domain-containing protein [Dolichospermum circinale]MDB9474085.1 peptidoglycan-binding domain-containing protein [Dolichospermum circinale CS-537/11]MDB9479832.1 peptidoglycan-binding domain-containing protein [Dolichospermum circinale CS-537/03]MDB9481063.1 peptidoglycan-binding domain-containing protein [Dolichospermum circinale CS-537/05]
MKLQNFLGTAEKWGYEAIANDVELSRQIQVLLIGLGLLEPPADGKFGPVSTTALKEFQQLLNTGEPEFLGAVTAKKLIEAKKDDLPKPALKLGNDIASKIVKYMLAENYQVSTNPKEYNIVYIEGINGDWTLNNDAANEFNDQRIVLEIINGVPKIVNSWQATTEPGSHYTYSPMNPKGAARIQFGQYKAWKVGYHGTANPHEALRQVGDITVCRDFNKDFKRTGDELDTGDDFYVNQHWGYDAPVNDIKNASAGCLVGRRKEGHKEFMAIIKQDRRYVANNDYIFYTTIIPGDDLLKRFPG